MVRNKRKRNITTSTRKKNKSKLNIRLLIVFAIILIALIFAGKFVADNVLNNVYSMTDLESNFDKIQVGDKLNYEINGYNDWQVLYT